MRWTVLSPLFSAALALSAGAGCSDDDTGADGAGSDVIGDAIADAAGDGTDAAGADGGDAGQDSGEALQELCSKPADCASGWCVESPKGLVCTVTCEADCPTGWQCKTVKNPAGDPVSICVNPTARLCHPCAVDDDCVGTGGGDNRCIDRGDGSFCGLACGADDGADCPAGYECDASLPVPQCVPSSGQCLCNDLATQLLLSTPCETDNAIGTCQGERVCEPGGLTACSALVAQEEICNGVDDDCDGQTDEDFVAQPCMVVNEFGACPGEEFCTFGQSQCVGTPAEQEACNGADDDCDGETDEDFGDIDQDGTVDCLDDDMDGDGALNDADCAPMDPAVHPGAAEVCDGKDTNCDGLVDNEGAGGCSSYYVDVDLDGHGAPGSAARCLCGPDTDTLYTATVADDCDDFDDGTYPGAAELCNGADDNCNGATDEAGSLAPCTVDNEHGSCPGTSQCAAGVLTCDGPTPQPEVCNGVDENCDGTTDEGFTDTDADGIADCVDDNKDGDVDPDDVDCAPLDPAINSAATEVCGNAVDENCDNQLDDEDAQGCTVYYQDADLDGFGSDKAPPKCLCAPEQSIYYTVAAQGDCNDVDFDANPTASEVCNGEDDNCNGAVDEGVKSPCGTCGSNCVLEVGAGEALEWDPVANPSSNVTVVGGALQLDTAAGLTGTYRVVFQGWPQSPNGTNWELFILTVSTPGTSSVQVRSRGATSQAALAGATWKDHGTFPPETFPVQLGQSGFNVLEVELTLATGSAADVPVVEDLTLVAKKAP